MSEDRELTRSENVTEDAPQAKPEAPAYQYAEVPVQPSRRGGFRLSAVIVPLLFMLLHLVVNTLSALPWVIPHAVKLASEGGTAESIAESLQTLLLTDQSLLLKANLLMCAILIPIYLLYLRAGLKRDPLLVMREKISAQKWGLSLIFVLGGMALTNLFIQLLQALAESSAFVSERLRIYEELVGSISGKQANFLLQVLVLAFLVPIAEELLFRGIVLGKFRSIMHPALAAVLSALLFGIFHANFIQSTYAFVLGLVLAFAYLYTKNIWTPIAMHCVFNFLGGILPSYIDQEGPAAKALGILVLICLGISCAWIIRGIVKAKQHKQA